MRRGEGDVIALNGSGWAPAAASLDRPARASASRRSRPRAPHAVTVPGAVASWARLAADHGTMALAELLQPAIEAAEHGYPVTERVARDWARQVAKLRGNAAAAEIFLPNGGRRARAKFIASRRSRRRCAASPATARPRSTKAGSHATWSRRCVPGRRAAYARRFFQLCAGIRHTDPRQLSRL